MRFPTHFQRMTGLGLFVLLVSASSPAQADLHSMAQDAHRALERALNPGGPLPSDADRTADLKEALKIIHDFPKTRNPQPRFYAQRSIKAALDEIASGQSEKATADIRDADSDVRDLE